MNNTELNLEFMRIYLMGNALDSIVELKKLEKIYKKSNFYKEMRWPIGKAYEYWATMRANKILGFVSKLDDAQYVGQLVTNWIENIDPQSIENFCTKITEVFNLSQFDDFKEELNKFINSLAS